MVFQLKMFFLFNIFFNLNYIFFYKKKNKKFNEIIEGSQPLWT